MDIIILNDGLYHLVPITKTMLEGLKLTQEVDCFSLCDIIRIEFTTYEDFPINRHIMNDGSGDFYGCIWN